MSLVMFTRCLDLSVGGNVYLCAAIGTFLNRNGWETIPLILAMLTVGLLCGLDRSYAVAFSFIMGIPAVLGANLLDLADSIAAGEPLFSLPLLVGVVVAAISGLASIKLVNYLVTSDKLRIFAWYTLALGGVVLVVGAVEQLAGHPVQQLVSSFFR